MQRLQSTGYLLLPLSEALAAARAHARVAALTFDDGYASILHVAFPILERCGGRATVFAVSDYVGRQNRWPGQPQAIPDGYLLDWQQLRELAHAGWEIGAHSRTHPDLRRLDERRMRDEIIGGKLAIEDRLGCSVDVFAYPYGLFQEPARQLVRDNFRAACSTKMGWATQHSDVHALERIETWYFGHYGANRLVGSPLMRVYVALCGAARSLHQHG